MRYTEDLTGGMTYLGAVFSGYSLSNAFDDNNSTIWYGTGTGGNVSKDRIIVDFGLGNEKNIQEVTLTPTNYSCKDFKIQYSDDNVNYIDIYNGTCIPGEKNVFQFSSSTKHRYWAVFILTPNQSGASAGLAEIEMMEIEINKFLIKQNNQYFSIKPEFYSNGNYSPLTLAGSNSMPNADDYNNNGFDDVGALCTSATIGTDTFRPVDKFGETKITGASFTTIDSKVYTVNPTTNVPFKQGSIVCYSDGNVVAPDSIDYVNGTVTFNTAQTGTMTFDYIYMYKFKIMMYKSS